MAEVMTVTGPVDADSLGQVLMHEHLICELQHHPRGFVAALTDVEAAIEEVAAFQAVGGRTLVEVSSRGLGRDIRKLRRIAEATGLNVVAGTGYYLEAYYPREVFERTIAQLADLMTREITEGIEDTGIRAGIIGEIGTRRHFITPAEERVFCAAARAQRRTGVAITSHTFWGGELALEQVAMLVGEGVPPNRIIVGHQGDTRDYDYVARVAGTGVFVQIDHIGKFDFAPDADRAGVVKEMIDRGFLGQILLSLDVCVKPNLHRHGGTGYDHLHRGFLPLLRRVGVTEEQIEMILVQNPQRALAGSL